MPWIALPLNKLTIEGTIENEDLLNAADATYSIEIKQEPENASYLAAKRFSMRVKYKLQPFSQG